MFEGCFVTEGIQHMVHALLWINIELLQKSYILNCKNIYKGNMIFTVYLCYLLCGSVFYMCKYKINYKN